MTLFRNFTPFPPLYFESRDEKQQDFGVVVLRGTFQIVNRQRLRLAEAQDPIVFVDEYYGDPHKTSLKDQACLIPFKPSTDVFVTANSYSPDAKPSIGWKASVKFGQVYKQLYITGTRHWERRMGAYVLSREQPINEVAVRYENAFGGSYEDRDGKLQSWPDNPVGKGFVGPDCEKIVEAPQIFANEKDARYLSFGRPVESAGLGPVAPHWAPRSERVGTYNEMWKRTRFPDLPGDFDFAFYNSASRGLTLDGFAIGDEVVEMENLSPDRRLVFALPGLELASLMRFDSGAVIPGPVMLDTIHIDAIEMRVHFVWRTVYPLNCGLRAFEIRAKDAKAALMRGA